MRQAGHGHSLLAWQETQIGNAAYQNKLALADLLAPKGEPGGEVH